MFKDQYESPNQSYDTKATHRNMLDQETRVAKGRHKENMNVAWSGILGGLGAMLLGVVWLGLGLLVGRLFIYPLFLIGGGFFGFISSIGYYQRVR